MCSGTPVLVASLETLLNVTAAVTADCLYPHIFPPQQEERTESSAEAFQSLLHSASAAFNSGQGESQRFTVGATASDFNSAGTSSAAGV
jgi:hypothetical protein